MQQKSNLLCILHEIQLSRRHTRHSPNLRKIDSNRPSFKPHVEAIYLGCLCMESDPLKMFSYSMYNVCSVEEIVKCPHSHSSSA